MPNTHSWLISQLECHPNLDGRDNVVFVIHWRRRASENEFVADIYGAQTIVFDSRNPFTPFDQLTKAQIETWLENAMGADKVAALDANLVRQIQNMKSPSIISPNLPWVSA